MLTLKNRTLGTGLSTFRKDDLARSEFGARLAFLFDTLKDEELSHADAAWLDADAITDLSGAGDGALAVAGGHTVTSQAVYGGADWSAAGFGATGVVGPAGSLTDIHAAGQFFMVVAYVVIPSAAHFNAGPPIAPFFSSRTDGYLSGPDMVTLAFTAGGNFEVRRQVNGAGGIDADGGSQLSGSAAGAYAQFAQFMYARTPYERIVRMKALNGVSVIDRRAGPGTDNSGDWSGNAPIWGPAGGFAPSENAHKFASPRGFVASAADWWAEPLKIADEDAARVFARAAALAAA